MVRNLKFSIFSRFNRKVTNFLAITSQYSKVEKEKKYKFTHFVLLYQSKIKMKSLEAYRFLFYFIILSLFYSTIHEDSMTLNKSWLQHF